MDGLEQFTSKSYLWNSTTTQYSLRKNISLRYTVFINDLKNSKSHRPHTCISI